MAKKPRSWLSRKQPTSRIVKFRTRRKSINLGAGTNLRLDQATMFIGTIFAAAGQAFSEAGRRPKDIRAEQIRAGDGPN